jgi:L-ascorbate metabolism protein UlaG (beta-lactamase superfamily)
MVRIQWLGAAGFRISINGMTILIDPFLTRKEKEVDLFQVFKSRDFREIHAIFLTHGHFDHSMDIPYILGNSPAILYCSDKVQRYFIKKGVDFRRIVVVRAGTRCIFDGLNVEVFPSNHLRFDMKLLIETLFRMKGKIFKLLHLLSYPCGDVFSFRFIGDSITFHHFGSAGSTDEELDNLSRFPLDLLLLPVQGNSKHFELALRYLDRLKPRFVIPHHHDDFFPPVSRKIDIEPFLEKLRFQFKDIVVKRLNFNACYEFSKEGFNSL